MKWIRKRVLSGELFTGAYVGLGSSPIAEIAGLAGFDWIWLDTEHGMGGYDSILHQTQAVSATPAAPIIRLVANEPAHFKRALDLGASGIMVPLVNNAAQATQAVQAMRYAPDGIRGLVHCHRGAGFSYNAEEYFAMANDNLLTIIQIETAQGFENADEIAAVEGVDVLFIGPADLSTSLGIPFQIEHPEFAACAQKIANVCKKHKKAAGILLQNPDQIEKIIADGFNFLALGTDFGIITKGFKARAQAFDRFKQT